MSSNPALELAETIQTASINRAPSPSHDLNPSTAASEKQPVKVFHHHPASDTSTDKYVYHSEDGIDDELDAEEEEGEDIPYDVLKPTPRRRSFGPLPDLRFEQSYLASIAGAETKWKVAFITIRDQVLMPLLQGTVWSLALHGWRFWNRSAQLSGSSVGARVRRWWWETNNWSIPPKRAGSGAREKFAGEAGDYYQNQSSSGTGD